MTYHPDHQKAKAALLDRLTLLKASPRSIQTSEDIDRLQTVIKVHTRLHPAPRPNCIDFTPRSK